MKYILLLFLLVSRVGLSQQVSPNDALRRAASGNDVAGIRIALEQGAQIDSTTPDGKTPLMHAAFLGHLDAIQFLVQRKADLNRRDAAGRTALMLAAGAHPEVVVALIGAGADVKIKDAEGRTALMNETDSHIRTLIEEAARKQSVAGSSQRTPPISTPTLSTTPIPVTSAIDTPPPKIAPIPVSPVPAGSVSTTQSTRWKIISILAVVLSSVLLYFILRRR
jgi:hypothetical protein